MTEQKKENTQNESFGICRRIFSILWKNKLWLILPFAVFILLILIFAITNEESITLPTMYQLF